MAFTITTFNFAKRANSTKQPTGQSGTDWSVVLKEKTSYDQPVFLLTSNSQPEFNYLQWGSWYYFITGISYVRNDLYEVSCDLDVLATYKAEIGETSAFVLYDTAANTEIVDNRLSMKSSITTQVSITESEIFDGNTSVVVGITGKGDTGLIVMSVSTARQLMRSIDRWMDEAEAIPWPEYDEPDPDPDDSGEDGSDDPPSWYSEDDGTGPGYYG